MDISPYTKIVNVNQRYTLENLPVDIWTCIYNQKKYHYLNIHDLVALKQTSKKINAIITRHLFPSEHKFWIGKLEIWVGVRPFSHSRLFTCFFCVERRTKKCYSQIFIDALLIIFRIMMF